MDAVSSLPLSLQLLILAYALVAVGALAGNLLVIWRGWACGRHRRRVDVVKVFTSALGGALRRFPRDLADGFWRVVGAP